MLAKVQLHQNSPRTPLLAIASGPASPSWPCSPGQRARPQGGHRGSTIAAAAALTILIITVQSCWFFYYRSALLRHRAGAHTALCIIVKEEPAEILDWIEHHSALGVQKFYVFDHSSSTPLIKDLYHLANAGLVTYEYFSEFTHPSGSPQLWVYDQCLHRYGHWHRYMGFLDADEYLVLKPLTSSLPELLQQYEGYGGLAANVRMFGSSGLLTRPNKTLNAYTKCVPMDHEESKLVKVIANTRYAVAAGPDPHTFVYRDGKYAVRENFARVDGARTNAASQDKVGIYHYITRSSQEYAAKMERGSVNGHLSKTVDFFNHVNEIAVDTCTDAVGHR